MFGEILGTAASIAGPIASIIGAREANDSNAKQAHLNRDFQQEMSSTSHQREVADLKAAGLNPILSANAGASTPSGSMATMQNTMDGMASSGAEIGRLMLATKKQKSEIGLLDAQTKKAQTEADVLRKEIPKSELTNDVYDIIRPYVQKIKNSLGSNSKSNDRPYTKELNQRHLDTLKTIHLKAGKP